VLLHTMLSTFMNSNFQHQFTSVSGLVVKSIVAIDGPRVRFAADALFLPWSRIFTHPPLLCSCFLLMDDATLESFWMELPQPESMA